MELGEVTFLAFGCWLSINALSDGRVRAFGTTYTREQLDQQVKWLEQVGFEVDHDSIENLGADQVAPWQFEAFKDK